MECTSRRLITTISGHLLELFLGIGVAVIGLLDVPGTACAERVLGRRHCRLESLLLDSSEHVHGFWLLDYNVPAPRTGDSCDRLGILKLLNLEILNRDFKIQDSKIQEFKSSLKGGVVWVCACVCV